ncbi:hypothetical protein [Micromonospora cremea]|uniref:hypothetical protein n=1 Tax=Micromonospora cremea TaxID=709881 RepID=UPI00117DF11C|nr:hypothetical protein [Micromonospora cremea]
MTSEAVAIVQRKQIWMWAAEIVSRPRTVAPIAASAPVRRPSWSPRSPAACPAVGSLRLRPPWRCVLRHLAEAKGEHTRPRPWTAGPPWPGKGAAAAGAARAIGNRA